MKLKLTIYLMIFCFFAPGAICYGQKNKVRKKKPVDVIRADTPLEPPPAVAPPAKISVYNTAIKEFESTEGGFKIKFPGAPKKNTSVIETAAGQIPFSRYSATGSVANYTVAVMDLPAPVTDPLELKVRYDGGRYALLKNSPGASLIEEKDIYFGDHFGRELVLEDSLTTATYRMFLVRQRLYQIAVVTPRLTGAPQSLQNSYKKTVADFFNSFVITSIPEAKAKAVDLPANFGLRLEGANFASDFFGFTVELPADWTRPTSEELEFINQADKNAITKGNPSVRDEFNLSEKNSKELLQITKFQLGTEENASLVFIAEKNTFSNFIPQKMLSGITDRLYVGQLGLQISQPVQTVKLGGIEFARVGLINPINNLKVQLYMANIKGIALEIVLNYVNESDLTVMEKSLQTLKFK